MAEKHDSTRYVGGMLGVMFGGLGVAMGVFFIGSSCWTALTSGWGGHGAELSLLIYGVILALPSAFAVRRGFHIIRAVRGKP